MRHWILCSLLLVGGIALGAGCGGDGASVGSEGGPCTEGGGCDPGLTCLSDRCVQLPDGGDMDGGGTDGAPTDGGGPDGATDAATDATLTSECDVGSQTGCAGQQTCFPAGSTTTDAGAETIGICDAAGSVPAGGTCDAIQDCVQGVICFSGSCLAVCELGSSETCFPVGPDFGFELPTCNILADDCTFEGWGCQVLGQELLCFPGGGSGDGEPCSSVGDCAAGHTCINEGGASSVCRPYCNTDDVDACSAAMATNCQRYEVLSAPDPDIPDNLGVCTDVSL